jgi:hypothetical protein
MCAKIEVMQPERLPINRQHRQQRPQSCLAAAVVAGPHLAYAAVAAVAAARDGDAAAPGDLPPGQVCVCKHACVRACVCVFGGGDGGGAARQPVISVAEPRPWQNSGPMHQCVLVPRIRCTARPRGHLEPPGLLHQLPCRCAAAVWGIGAPSPAASCCTLLHAAIKNSN